MVGDEDGNHIFPFWPAKEYANNCAISEWSDYEAKNIPLDDLLNVLLPKLINEKMKVSVFVVPDRLGSIVTHADRLLFDLKKECENYE